jgi:hypothetical protein
MTDEQKVGGVKGGGILLAHAGRNVVLQFLPDNNGAMFDALLTPEAAVRLAQMLVKHAMAAGHGEPVTFTFGASDKP